MTHKCVRSPVSGILFWLLSLQKTLASHTWDFFFFQKRQLASTEKPAPGFQCCRGNLRVFRHDLIQNTDGCCCLQHSFKTTAGLLLLQTGWIDGAWREMGSNSPNLPKSSVYYSSCELVDLMLVVMRHVTESSPLTCVKSEP